MSFWPRSLSVRLAVMFAVASVLLLGGIGFYLYQSLQREVASRDDQALMGRLQRMQALIDDSDSIEALRSRPQLYENMLGNRDSLLWIIDAAGKVLIEINPVHVPVPRLPAAAELKLASVAGPEPMRLAWQRVDRAGGGLTLIAGKLLAGREEMLAAYRLKLDVALTVGGLLAFLLGWLVSQRGLRPVRQLAARVAAIDVQHLHVRLGEFKELRELQLLSETLNTMLARLEDGFALLSRFSEDLAHEMRTPLSNLMGQTQQTLGRTRSVEVYQNLLVSNQEEYERLARMIDNMLFLARTEQPDAAVQRERVELTPLVEQLIDYFEGMAAEREIRLINRAEGALLVDHDLLRRALANLLANALRYGAPVSSVTVSSRQHGGMTELNVHNRGAPIAAEDLPRLFERFYRCDPSRAQPGDSGGLGLAIVRSIMQLHGGCVSVTSTAESTCFTLQFPTGSE